MASPLLMDRVSRLMDQIEYRVAESDADLMAVGRLRYAAYRREELIRPVSHQTFVDEYDEDANAVTFMALVGGKLAGTIRLHLVRRAEDRCPAMSVFSDILGPLLARQLTIVDPSRLAVDPSMDRSSGMAYALLRLPILASYYYNIDFGTATVKSDHRAFYARVMRSHQVGEARSYPISPNPIYLMLSNLRKEREAIAARFPFFRFRHDQETQIFDRIKFSMADAARPPVGHEAPGRFDDEMAGLRLVPNHSGSVGQERLAA